jgi:hypothetical protein
MVRANTPAERLAGVIIKNLHREACTERSRSEAKTAKHLVIREEIFAFLIHLRALRFFAVKTYPR